MSTADVAAFYDKHPYPPATSDLGRYRHIWQDTDRRRADYHLLWPSDAYREDLCVLVAGCGTSQGAKHALRQPESQVVAIDISSTSLDRTRDLKQQYDLANLEIVELPVERVVELNQSFDKIVCTGVLHHLPDPDRGLRALRDVLRPDGAMQLMVYARYGRTGIYMLQDYCRRLGVGTSEEEIRALATTLAALPRAHPIAHLLGTAPDFRTAAGVADALLHPQDRAYTVPELFDWTRTAGLTFGRWVRQAPYRSRCGSLAGSPHGARLAEMPLEEEYAAVELFRGTMTRHEFVAHGAHQANGGSEITFADDGWLDFVPIRLPRTVCIDDERVPADATAVLINQSHTDPDLVLPIDEDEKRLFDRIDGQRTIATIAGVTETAHDPERREHARRLFESLWWYDQVVFDASSRS